MKSVKPSSEKSNHSTQTVSDSHEVDPRAEHNKQRFLKLVEALVRLRELQFDNDDQGQIVNLAQQVVAANLPSNALRAAAIFVDYVYGYPPQKASFFLPAWVTSKELLPEDQRGSLACSGLQQTADLEAGDAIVLTRDIPAKGLTAGMAGVIKELPGSNGGDARFLVEFGEPKECLTVKAEVPMSWLRPPRPGDLLECFRC